MMDHQSATARAAVAVSKIKSLRWYICGLLFFATVVNYIDRQVLGSLAPELKRSLGWTESEYSQIVIWFQIAYGVMFLVWGGLIDRIGVKLGFSLAIIWWSMAGMGHALVTTAMGFAFARFMLGVGEAANFPAALKTVAEWFPKRERALATGIFNAGTNVGAIIAPAAALTLSAHYGWQSAFLFTGGAGLIWLGFWWKLYKRPEEHPRLSNEEFKLIRDGEKEEVTEKTPWLPLFGYRQLWAFAFGKMLTDPVWWFYLFWLPKFLDQNYGVKGTALIPYLTTVYVIADVGSVGGGWISSTLIKRGWTVNRARKTALFIFAVVMPLVTVAYYTESAWIAVILIGIAAGAHQGFSANLFTLTADMFPRKAVGSVVGIGSCAGAIGGTLLPLYAGKVLDANPSYYLPMFVIAGVTYLVAWVVIHLLAPRLEPAKIE
ncbi:MAG TPA: MFS transporter [Blastocatellia bacterium]|jgi:ACS family hexuronate transporter-like MFS transporter